MNLDGLCGVSTTASGSARLRTYATAATGRMPIVFLHAGVCGSRMWHREIAALSPTRRVVAFDRRGFGATRSVHQPYSNVDDTIAVLDALDVDRAVLVGCSNGGRTALDTYFAHPARVAGLGLICGAIGGAPESDEWHTDERMKALYTRHQAAEASHDRAALARIAAHVWLDGPHEREGRVGGPARALFLDMIGKSLVDAEDEDAGFDSADAYADLSQVTVPTLVVWGLLDVPDVTRTMKHAAATIRGAHSLEVVDAAHLPNLERPDLLMPRLEALVSLLN